MRLYAVVEYCLEELGDKPERFGTCLAHTTDRSKAEAERDRWAKPVYKIDEAFSYSIVSFRAGHPCPICRRNFIF